MLLLTAALHCAASKGHAACVETLLQSGGVAVDGRDGEGCTPLFYSLTLQHRDCTAVLLRHGAHPNTTDIKMRRPVAVIAV